MTHMFHDNIYLFDYMFQVHKCNDFELVINNCYIVPKDPNKTVAFLDNRGLHLHISSQYFPEFDNTVYDLKFTQLSAYVSGKYVSIGLVEKMNGIAVCFSVDKKNNDLTFLLNMIRRVTHDHSLMMDSFKFTLHMYGTCELLTFDLIKRLEIWCSYYIVTARGPVDDYSGQKIKVFQYYGIDHFKCGYHSEYRLAGVLFSIVDGVLERDEELIRSYDGSGIFVYGGNDCPVHVITRLRSNFKLPDLLPKAINLIL
jgi:hypothetical protein